jgi:hypothetical protein
MRSPSPVIVTLGSGGGGGGGGEDVMSGEWRMMLMMGPEADRSR